MYFSNHNNKITYINHYSGLLEVEGEGALCREDTEVWGQTGTRWANGYDVLSVTEGITAIGEGYLEAFKKIDCLILSHTVKSVAASAELISRMHKRKVLIRGEYDSYAEKFAAENKLDFLHSDIHLADDFIEAAYERDIITLRFHLDGPPDIHFNCFTPGSSAGSYGGGEYAKELPRDFFVGCTIEKFAKRFPKRLLGQLLNNAALNRFLRAANRRLDQKDSKPDEERNKETKLSMIFEEKPETWGYRGDPYFWDYLKDKAENMDIISPDELEEWIKKEYFSLSGKEMTPGGCAVIEQFAHGGMSSGGVDNDWWLENGIPLLKSRLAAL